MANQHTKRNAAIGAQCNVQTVQFPDDNARRRKPKPGSVRAVLAEQQKQRDTFQIGTNGMGPGQGLQIGQVINAEMPGEISTGLNRIGNAVTLVENAIDELLVRLEHVLMTEHMRPDGPATAVAKPESPVGEKLEDFARRIFGLEDQISVIIRRVAR